MAKTTKQAENLEPEELNTETPDVKPETEEILFLRKILHIQHEGGFGRHLDVIINERIKELNG